MNTTQRWAVIGLVAMAGGCLGTYWSGRIMRPLCLSWTQQGIFVVTLTISMVAAYCWGRMDESAPKGD